MKPEFGEYLVRTLAANGIALQNSLNQYALESKLSRDSIESLRAQLKMIEIQSKAMADELTRLRIESAKETKNLLARIERIRQFTIKKPSRKPILKKKK